MTVRAEGSNSSPHTPCAAAGTRSVPPSRNSGGTFWLLPFASARALRGTVGVDIPGDPGQHYGADGDLGLAWPDQGFFERQIVGV